MLESKRVRVLFFTNNIRTIIDLILIIKFVNFKKFENFGDFFLIFQKLKRIFLFKKFNMFIHYVWKPLGKLTIYPKHQILDDASSEI